MNIDKAFKLWWNGVGKFFHKEIKKDAFTAGYKQSRIDTLEEALKIVAKVRSYYSEDIFPKDSKTVDAQSADMARITCDNIDTELKKAKDD